MPGACPRREYFGKLLPKFNHSRNNIPEKVRFLAYHYPISHKGFFCWEHKVLLEQEPEVLQNDCLTVTGGAFDQPLRFAQICPPNRAHSQVTACQMSCGN